jgi:hypothetical protein
MTSTTKRRMKMNDVKIESISTLVLGKDDIVVVNFPPSNLPPSKLEEYAKTMLGYIKDIFTRSGYDNQIIALANGMTITKITKEENENGAL